MRPLLSDNDLEREVQQHVTELVPQLPSGRRLDRMIQLERLSTR